MSPRSTEPKEFRPLDIGAALAAVVLLLVAFVAVARYHTEDERLRDLAFDASQVEVAAYKVNLLEWNVITGRTRKGGAESSDALFQDIDRKLNELVASVGDNLDLRLVAESFGRYRQAAVHEFNLMGQGRLNEARLYDETTVDPAFDTFVAKLSRVKGILAENAEFADVIERWASVIIIGTAVALVILLARWHQRRVIRENRSHALRLGAEAGEKKMRALLERSTTQVLVTDGQGVIVDEWAPVKPFSLMQVPRLGEKVEDIVAKSSRQTVVDALQRIHEGVSTQQFDVAIGEEPQSFAIDCSVTNYLEEPLIGGLLWTLTDVTEKHRAAAKFTEVHDRLNSILFLSHAAVWSASLDGFAIDYISAGCEPIFGRTPAEFIEKPNLWIEAIHPDDRESVYAQNIAELRQTGEVMFEYRIVRPDGTVRWVANSIRLKRDSEGSLIRKEGAVFDITKEKLARIELSESRKRYERTVARVPCVIYQLQLPPGGHLHFSYVGPQCDEILGLDPKEIVDDASVYYRNVHPDDLVELNRRRRISADLGEEFIWEGRVKVRGEYRWFKTWAVPDGDATGLKLWDGISFDITDSKRAQEIAIEKATAEQANAAKSDFLSRMSHELRTPLNAILGFGQLLQMQTHDSGQHVMLGHIVEGGRHLLSLVNEILDISRIESHRIAINPESVNLPRLLREVVDLSTPAAMAHGVEINILASGQGANYAYADPQRLRQILVNLVTNAVKYNRPGGHVFLECAESGGRIQIVVEDNGPGIDPELRHRLFTAFDRLGAEQTKIEGTGLGLALSQRLAEAMDGAITYEEAAGGGCRFSVELPATADCPEPPPDSAPGQPPVSTVRRDVLYIEDNLSNVELMKSVVGRINVNLVVSTTGREGIERARDLQPDLILLDLDLPDILGQEVLRELTNSLDTQHIPVVIVSADANLSRIQMAAEGGASGYLTKPFDVPRVLSILQHGPEGDYV